jgi:hypothetical protein
LSESNLPVHSHDDDWKNPQFISAWKATRLQNLEQIWEAKYKPLFVGLPLAERRDTTLPGTFAFIEKTLLHEGESLTERAHRLEATEGRGRNRSRRSTYSVNCAIGKDDAGEFVIAEWARAATPNSIECAKFLYEIGLEKKAQRRIACTVLWAARHCPSWHRWRVAYQCGNRYCQNCGPRRARKLQGESLNKLTPVTADIREKNKSAVIAAVDFTWRNTGRMPDAEEVRLFNACIRKCFRILKKRFRFKTSEFGFMWCDEFGGKNTNLHAHGIYVGPWIPQGKRNKQLSRAWAEATGGIAKIAYIKLRPDLAGAIAHAVKYPAKYIERSEPARLALLESVFHRVRRFHSIGRFYGAKKQDVEDQLDFCSCPICQAPLSDIVEWVPLAKLSHLPDLEAFILNESSSNERAPPVRSLPMAPKRVAELRPITNSDPVTSEDVPF